MKFLEALGGILIICLIIAGIFGIPTWLQFRKTRRK